MENKNEDNNDDLEDSDGVIKNNKIIKIDNVITIHTMAKKIELELVWNKILAFSKDIQKKDLLIKYCDLLTQYLKNELIENKIDPDSDNHIVIEFFKNNIVLEKITNFIISCPDNREVFIGYSSYFLNILKFKEEIIKNNKLLKKTIFQTIIQLFEELKRYRFKFKLKN